MIYNLLYIQAYQYYKHNASILCMEYFKKV
jgi:hypothetical protein